LKHLHAIGGLVLALVAISRASIAAPPPGARSYVLAIGYNGLPPGGDASLQPLRFADDDAISFFAFASAVAHRAHLLTVVDVDTQRRLGASVPAASPPTTDELRRAVADLHAALADDARAGIRTTVYIYYSGHGSAAPGRDPALALLDGDLTRSKLYDDVLAELPATYVHLFVDACHAEAVVRPRDAEAHVVPTTDEDRSRYTLVSTLARFPNTGAVMAATGSAQSHEWETYLGGVFTHELLSGLRGAADVNADGRIEYSEIAAFLAAANGSVRDPRARLDAVTHAPLADPRASIVDLRRWPGAAVLEGRGAESEPIFVEDDRGNRLVDLRPERDFAFGLVLPADRTWYVHTGRGEAEIRPTPGERIAIGSLALFTPPSRPRGALEAALHEGLFATSFGPAYYRGFVDAGADFAPVPLRVDEARGPLRGPEGSEDAAGSRRLWGWTVAGTSAALALGAGAFGVLSLQARSDFDHTSFERAATEAEARYTRDTTAAIVLGASAVALAGVATYLFARPHANHRAAVAPTAHGLALEF
jgi:hypothetical protein